MDAYEVLSKIGDGTFGTVYLCRRRQTSIQTSQDQASSSPLSHSGEPTGSTIATVQNELVAIKKMKRNYYSWSDCMQLREVNALKNLNHSNVVLLKEVIRENNHLYLVFEHMEENLYQLMRNQLAPFPEATIKQIIIQVIEGLGYIHKHGFFHRDIKPENLLCKGGPKSIKIADFGLTREIDSEPPFTDYVSTRWYRAPELLLHSTNYNWSVDIWAVGCITGELYTLKPMFPGRSEIDQIHKICQVLGAPNRFDWPEGQRLASTVQFSFPNLVPLDLTDILIDCSRVGVDLIQSMLKWVPGSRLSASELLNHSFFRT